MTYSEYIREHLLRSVGFCVGQTPDLEKLRETEWCEEYELACRNRMVMGAFRYGPMGRQELNGYDLPAEAKKRLKRYEETGRIELLADAGNMCMLEYYRQLKQGVVLESEDDGEHAEPTG